MDARSDLYSLGAVGYWLLTGKTLFDSDDVETLLNRQVDEHPLKPSERSGRPCATDLEQIILKSLAKSPEQRQPSAEALDQALAGCVAASTWTAADAERWWRVNVISLEPAPATPLLKKTLVIAPRS